MHNHLSGIYTAPFKLTADMAPLAKKHHEIARAPKLQHPSCAERREKLLLLEDEGHCLFTVLPLEGQ